MDFREDLRTYEIGHANSDSKLHIKPSSSQAGRQPRVYLWLFYHTGSPARNAPDAEHPQKLRGSSRRTFFIHNYIV